MYDKIKRDWTLKQKRLRKKDYDGQKRAEHLSRIIITLFGSWRLVLPFLVCKYFIAVQLVLTIGITGFPSLNAVGLVWGYIIQQFSQTVYIVGAGFALAAIVTTPPWPMYRRKPLQWQKPRPEGSEGEPQQKSKKKK